SSDVDDGYGRPDEPQPVLPAVVGPGARGVPDENAERNARGDGSQHQAPDQARRVAAVRLGRDRAKAPHRGPATGRQPRINTRVSASSWKWPRWSSPA